MSRDASASATELPAMRVVQAGEAWLTWAPDGPGLMQCRSHALRADDGRTWLVDPIDVAGLARELDARGFGDVAGIIVLLDRHVRDSARMARRLGVELHVPAGRWRSGHPAPAESRAYLDRVEGAPFQLPPVIHRDGAWLEHALWWPQQELLVVAEAVGRAEYYLSRSGEPLGTHPMLRIVAPPHAILELHVRPGILLLGHGDPLEGDIAAELDLAIRDARTDLPAFALALPRHAVRLARAALGIGRASC